MTREEAIERLNNARSCPLLYESHIEALDMAIKALEQTVNIVGCDQCVKATADGRCEDAISREAVCDYIAEFVNNEYSTQAECEMVDFMIEGIQHLPSVTQKSGKWIFDDNSSATVCPNCKQGYLWEDYKGTSEWNFCPMCGAKMESEDKE